MQGEQGSKSSRPTHQEGEPFHTRGKLASYCAPLRATGRGRWADFLEKHSTGLE